MFNLHELFKVYTYTYIGRGYAPLARAHPLCVRAYIMVWIYMFISSETALYIDHARYVNDARELSRLGPRPFPI